MDKTMSTGAMKAERCKVLYSYLIAQGNQWTELIDICEALDGYYPYLSWLIDVGEAEAFHDTNARMMITNDIRYINQSGNFEKIIISGKKGVKIASREEAQKYIRNLYSAIFRKLKRARLIEKKAAMDGQTTFNEEVIRAFIES